MARKVKVNKAAMHGPRRAQSGSRALRASDARIAKFGKKKRVTIAAEFCNAPWFRFERCIDLDLHMERPSLAGAIIALDSLSGFVRHA
ncbi:hypothetical protein [Ralstonia solanacearum]|uniref:hypothetical protein n=1 Tax=Ralstonia solanacearum TaxID=305 RepID=UPI0015F85939|nr:hypothetical protein [Ralstonia solanacearum]